MKKFFVLAILLGIFTVSQGFSQNQVKSANRNTALRCLKLAENCLVGNDWENAVKQADLGLTYDENISDLIYVKAAAEINLGKTKAEILKLINIAFEKNDWVGYSKNGARIILADLLCDTGSYEESLMVLDSDPLLFSADAEYIRIKNYYRMGTPQSINNARLKLNSSRRIYPADVRFPEIFFMFETLYLNEAEKRGNKYEIPEIVKTISAAYIAKLPDYTGTNPQLELMALFFADEKTQNRLVKAIDAKNQTIHPLLAIAGLKNGMYTEEQAVDIFFNSYEGAISLDMLENLVYLIKTTEVQEILIEKLSDFSGEVIIDENYDLQNEIRVKYEKGRPLYISYDLNNDGELDLYSTCDLGAPLYVHYYQNKSEVFYDGFPKVSKVHFIEEDYSFNFLHDDFMYAPYALNVNKIMEALGIDFYVPAFAGNLVIPEIETIAKKSSSVELPVNDRDDATVVFTINEGNLVFANYFEQDRKYAVCDFTTGFPYTRYVDFDNDGYFETSEIYAPIPMVDGFDLEKEKSLIHRTFTKILDSENIYLKKILIDRNGNTNYEFSEEYTEFNGKISLWDNDDNGIWDCQYIRYPQKNGESLVEETIYYSEAGLQNLLINTIDGVPVKILDEHSEVMVYAGKLENFYWIEEVNEADLEEKIYEKVSKEIIQGAIEIVQLDESRVSVIKIDKNYYCRMLPESEIIDEQEAAE